jgi:hypothetical protein
VWAVDPIIFFGERWLIPILPQMIASQVFVQQLRGAKERWPSWGLFLFREIQYAWVKKISSIELTSGWQWRLGWGWLIKDVGVKEIGGIEKAPFPGGRRGRFAALPRFNAAPCVLARLGWCRANFIEYRRVYQV